MCKRFAASNLVSQKRDFWERRCRLVAAQARATDDVEDDPDNSRRIIFVLFFAQVVAIGLVVVWQIVTRLLDVGGTRSLQDGRLAESVSWFDATATVGMPRWQLWKRGIALYYADRFADAASQFREDLTGKPTVFDESCWLLLCEARQGNFYAARAEIQNLDNKYKILSSISPGIGRSIFTLFSGGEGEATAKLVLEESAKTPSLEGFYAALYLGLFAEARGDVASSRRWICFAADCDWAVEHSSDFMVGVAKLHARLRGWNRGVP